MLEQRRRRWADIVQLLYKCFVFAGVAAVLSCPKVDRRVQTAHVSMEVIIQATLFSEKRGASQYKRPLAE